ncbi:ubiquinone biosynthesis UbiH/UbiF/VisC/COQ6 family hydroxylase [Paenalcaligenes hominis]|uniref:Ubiquinone biosynthesis UbiH/UbiF/VisC/COQ6 family hydroxylase n=1 Tax=Paenalcaligenes hominis TaxID=643674 RepID=A0ABX0WQI9_9BURK|nr:FAD-dependent monooxygenase [Paenalcaligenes hominis]NJB65088.1 ubiquinone biosynthesis UbiH/UbiF/VisC/COQ6 family hydroxylase [Paenalcaligenes hominis]GGE56763.1 monooxygenase [Paenalcaligenes hominis]
MNTHESIVVCGGGLAGMATALGLKKAGFAVRIVAPAYQAMTLAPHHFHPRVYALSAASQAFLEQLGVWRLMRSERITPVTGMELFGDGDGFVQLDAWHNAQSNLTWIVESGEMEHALYQALQVFNVPWHDDLFAELTATGLKTQRGDVLSADLIVGADGARSLVRAKAHIEHHQKPYHHDGVVAHLHTELPHQNRAYQWFTGDSVLALLPMPDTDQGPQVSMVWSVQAQQAQAFMALDAPQQQDHVQRVLGALTQHRLGQLQLRSQPFAFPLTLERSAMIAPRVALVGDAAHRVHPLAGQGLNLGLGDIQELIQVLTDKPSYQRVGELRVLERYRRARLEPILAMRLMTHGLHQLFVSQAAPIALARNVGMKLVDKLPFIKRQLIQRAAGK